MHIFKQIANSTCAAGCAALSIHVTAPRTAEIMLTFALNRNCLSSDVSVICCGHTVCYNRDAFCLFVYIECYYLHIL